MTQKQMAVDLGILPSAYGNYENSYSQPNYELLETITKKLGVNAHELLFADLEKAGTRPQDVEVSVNNPGNNESKDNDLQSLRKEIKQMRKEIDELKKVTGGK